MDVSGEVPSSAPRPPPVTTVDERPRPTLLRRAVPLVVIAVIIIAIVQLAGELDWNEITAAVGLLQGWQLAVLLVCVGVRQFLNALPLTIYIDGIGPLRAMQNQQAAVLFTTVAPPPSDLVLRLRMFRSWGISSTEGLAGTILNTLAFYIACFGAPLIGAALFAVTPLVHPAGSLPAVLCGALSVVLLVLLRLSLRGEAQAASVGYRAGQLVHRVRRSVDPARWRDSVVDFRRTVSARAWTRFPRALAALAAMIGVEAGLLVLCVRFVGVTPEQLGALAVVAAFLVAYPLILLPFSGLGLLDAAVIATLMLQVGVDQGLEPDLVAAFAVWRIGTLLVPLVLGALSLLTWKIQTARQTGERASGVDSG
jgi:putative heme transporter